MAPVGGHGLAYAELPLAWAPDEDTAVQAVLEKNSFALTGCARVTDSASRGGPAHLMAA